MSQLVARHMVARGRRRQDRLHLQRPCAHSLRPQRRLQRRQERASTTWRCTIAAELLPHRINVNVIEPGWIDTPGEHETFGSDQIAAAAPTLPWGRLGTPDDIGRAAVVPRSDDADYITGTSLLVDGGLALRAAMPIVDPRTVAT